MPVLDHEVHHMFHELHERPTRPVPADYIGHVPVEHEIETFTGRYVDLSDPDPRDIDIHDIAHGLANCARYSGHTKRFYSVAEHAVAVSKRLEALGKDRTTSLAGLHHDDAEAYLGDIPRPLKSLLQPNYGKLTAKMEAAIAHALDAKWPADALHLPEVKDADNWALMVEAKHLLPSAGAQWAGAGCNWDVTPVDEAAEWRPLCLSPEKAEAAFLSRHWSLIDNWKLRLVR